MPEPPKVDAVGKPQTSTKTFEDIARQDDINWEMAISTVD
jgi:hypothetical protein